MDLQTENIVLDNLSDWVSDKTLIAITHRNSVVKLATRVLILDQGVLVDDRYDWKKSTLAAAEYFERLGKRFDYDWALALAAYNGGPNYLAKTMKQQGKDNYWDLKLREEPQNYVPKFLAMLQVAKEKYPSLYYQGAPKFWIVAAN